MKRSTVVAANSNKSIFGQNGPWIGVIQFTQQTICREFKNCYINSLLQNTMNVSNIIYSFLVTIFVILNNPQITKARSENFKSEITNFFGLSMWVGISEAIRLLSTCLLSISRSMTSRIEFLNNIIEKYSLILRNSLVLDTAYNTMSTDTKTNIDSDMPEDTKINTNTSSSNNGSPKSTDGENSRGFYEWLAGLIDGDGWFSTIKERVC